MLHTYVLSGGDHFINLVTFAAFFASVIGVSAVAGALGLGSKGQAFAALVCATSAQRHPPGVRRQERLSAGVLAGLLVYFVARRDAPFSGLAAGLALATKATAYLFAPPLVAGCW